MKPKLTLTTCLVLALIASTATCFAQREKKPNILVIFGDDIGVPQISAYTQGLMGYQTPNQL